MSFDPASPRKSEMKPSPAAAPAREPWLRRLVSDELDGQAVEPAPLDLGGADPFAGVDWAASRRAVLAQLPERPASSFAPPPVPALGRAIRYGMLAASFAIAASLSVTLVRRQYAGRPPANTAGAGAAVADPVRAPSEVRSVRDFLPARDERLISAEGRPVFAAPGPQVSPTGGGFEMMPVPDAFAERAGDRGFRVTTASLRTGAVEP